MVDNKLSLKSQDKIILTVDNKLSLKSQDKIVTVYNKLSLKANTEL